MMRWLALLVLALGLADCGRGQRLTPTVTPAPLPFSQAWALFTRSRFRATFEVQTSDSEKSRTSRVTWYKDGTTRQRFDLTVPMANGALRDFVVFLQGDQIVVCTSGQRAGCQQGSNAAEVGVLSLYALGFGYELEPRKSATQLNLSAGEAQPTTVSGTVAWCYSTHASTPVPIPDTQTNIRYCFASSGAIVRRESNWLSLTGFNSVLTLVGDISTPRDSDFQLPYALTVEPTP